jgi:hypothetical protein
VDADRLANNLRGKYKRGAGLALQITMGSFGGLIGSNIFRTQDAPRYLLGRKPSNHPLFFRVSPVNRLDGLAIMFISIGLIAIPIIVLAYKRLNARLDREELLEKQHGENVEPNLQEASGFRYTL